MRSSKLILKQLQIIPILLVFGIICSCENDIEKAMLVAKEERAPIRSGKNVELIYSEKAHVKIKVTAPLMKEYEGDDHYQEMEEGIHVVFYDSLMNKNSTLTSKYAIHRMEEKKMEVENDVVIVNAKGEQLNTEHLIWLQESEKIYTDSFVKITTGDEIIMGDGLEANQDFSKWRIHKIRGTILLKEKEDSLETK